MEYDRPALDAGCRDELLDYWRKDSLDMAAYTVRPSLLGSPVPERILPYAPEADLALQINGLDAVPRMGYGQVYRAAELAGISPDLVIKPSPVQALGAIGAAVCRDELQAMLAAVNWIYRGDSTYFERLPALDIHIFEDSGGSILGVKRASDRLNKIGVPVQFHAWGIANSPVKIAALQSAQAEISSNVNDAVQKALSRLYH
jgi:hypothetical protein